MIRLLTSHLCSVDAFNVLNAKQASNEQLPAVVPPVRKPPASNLVRTDTEVCRIAIDGFVAANDQLCRAQQGHATRVPDITPTESRNVQFCDREESCSATFDCSARRDHGSCPLHFLQAHFDGEFELTCHPDYPHLSRERSGPTMPIHVRCKETAWLWHNQNIRVRMGSDANPGTTWILPREGLRLSNAVDWTRDYTYSRPGW